MHKGQFSENDAKISFKVFYSREKKPYTNDEGEVIEENRYGTSQPFRFREDDYNNRALNNLPYLRLHAGHVDLLKKECLANVHFGYTHFLLSKLYG
ncbi:hypothetical protein DPMN_098988 [Dreissena polymorpha]|uniref:Uncharacterized protein n=1 Tax=Dreissena polymorpha TaxID=45954 RepID=A0A9D4LD82_DREPO|nr:hypothetical protein DPMN_098984 [Dreissena polymorpha]KAH3856398.1 hypothetical protein DPMN_098986 [Dreissena polymorpha]KAH3856400.1 hypothetical protein DPMN_098988 [Dreissena polymorpha]